MGVLEQEVDNWTRQFGQKGGGNEWRVRRRDTRARWPVRVHITARHSTKVGEMRVNS